MELLQLKYFCTVAQLESMTEAARIHHIPQSAMSKTILKLEAELGKKLFDRVGNHLRLNHNGKSFLHHVQNGLTELNNAVFSTQDPSLRKGEIKLLVMEIRRRVTDAIIAFHQRYPDIQFSISHNIYEQSHSEFDLYVASVPQEKGTFHRVFLFHEQICLAVQRSHPLSRRTSVRLEELRGENFIFLPEKNGVNRIMMDRCRQQGLEPKISIICDDPFYVRKYISAGLGIAFAPSDSWNGLYDETGVLVPIDDPGTARDTYLYWQRERSLSYPAVLFKDFLLEQVQEEATLKTALQDKNRENQHK